MSKEIYSQTELDKYKKAQKLAYEAVQHVEANLFEGITEIEAAKRIEAYLRQQGIVNFFHHSFVWFGERTRFKDFLKPDLAFEISRLLELPHFGQQFQPTEKKLEKGMAVILDVAPAIDGCAADIGYSFSYGKNDKVSQGNKDLEDFRTLVLEGVKEEKSLAQIYQEVNELINWLGYENIHSYYPGAVLGHKVGRIPAASLPTVTYLGFDLQTFAYLGWQKLQELFTSGKDPLWGPFSNFRAEPGLWAVEPHIGRGDIGVKWEEILVVTETDAFWLDDDLPHVNRWKKSNERKKRQPELTLVSNKAAGQ